MVKRIIDIKLSIIGLILFAPLLILVACRIECPVFYRGERVGKNGKPFKMLKFRTMYVGASERGGSSTPADDLRITKMGHFLRKWKIDELPQLFNILIGKMSFIGPRPEVKEYVDMMLEAEKAIILSVRPGLTDLATLENMSEGERLRGAEDPEREYMTNIRPMKVRLQKEYVLKRSLVLDMKIFIFTLWRLIH